MTVKRSIYFVRNNTLYTKTIEVPWDKDCMDVNKVICKKCIEDGVEPFMGKCIDVSSSSNDLLGRNLNSFKVQDDKGYPVKNTWALLSNNKDSKYNPPGVYDYVYCNYLTEEQVRMALTCNGFYDIFENPDKVQGSVAKSLASLVLLSNQYKLDYLYEPNKYLWWYYINCAFPVEWFTSRDLNPKY